MRNILLVILLFIALAPSKAQNATNFSCNDCNSVSHDLFDEIDAGNVVVLCWVMPCSNCISGALTCNNVCHSYPNNVLMYLCDDYANTNCATLNSWANTNNITPTATFSNATIRMSDYGSTGMPKAVVIGGPNHTVFYNANNTFNSTAMQTAINQALAVTAIKEEDKSPNISSISVYPSPSTDITTVKFNSSKPGEVNIEIFDLEGKKIQNIFTGTSTAGENKITINMEAFPAGMYLVKLSEGTNSEYANVVVSH